ncbi:MAG: UDPglucose 6-dehydrogenase, partial [Cryomorphaceae bacterium]
AFDPEAMDNVKTVHGDTIEYSENMYSALENADALLIATEWGVFRSPDFKKVIDRLKAPVIFDGRNLYEPSQMKELGFHYESIGREKITS